ncbi:MAG: diguanylate cyclase [Desulfurivibrionaceae bacterium]|jgi:diguanylate cyclase (GGDEF)-like protein/PAS domain S-box-containing protein
MTLKILVVDNHPMILKLLANFLEKEGHEVMTASDGLAALSVLEVYTPDVIFVDLVMPNIGGDKLCRIIRSIPRFADLFIVILSAIAAEDDVDYKKFGGNACIAKGSIKSIQKHVLEIIHHLADKSPATLEPVANLEDIQYRTITRELLSSKNHFEAIINNMSEAVFELTTDGTIIFANLAALSLCNLAEEKLLASNLIALFSEETQERITRLLAHPERLPQLIEDDPPLLLNGKHAALHFLELRQNDQPSIILIAKDISERYEAEQALQANETRFRELFNNMSSGVAVYEAKNIEATDFVFVDFNRAAERINKIRKDQVIGRSLLEVFPGAREFGFLAVLQRVWQTGKPQHHPVALYKDNRLSGWRENYLYKLPSGEVVAIFEDATARKQAEDKLAFESAMNGAVARISRMIISSDSLKDISAALLEEILALTGSKHGIVDLVDEKTNNLLAMAFSPEIRTMCAMQDESGACVHAPQGLINWVLGNKTGILSNSPLTDYRTKGLPPGPASLTRLLAVPAMFNNEFLGILSVANSPNDYEKRDLDTLEHFASLFALAAQKKQAQDHIAHLAHHDPLTGLINRHIFPDRLAQAMILSQRHRKKIALLYVDLDKFKQINDAHGHMAGDAVLKEIASRLLGLLRDSDTVARMGGDEFVIILHDIAGKTAVNQVAEKIIDTLAKPIFFHDTQFTVTVSVGISIYPDDDKQIDALIQKADKAMYQAKKSDTASHIFYEG